MKVIVTSCRTMYLLQGNPVECKNGYYMCKKGHQLANKVY